MMKFFVLVVLAWGITPAHADVDVEYYGVESISELSSWDHNPDLRNQLFQLLHSNYRVLSYHDARVKLFGQLFLKRDSRGYFVTCVYCEIDYYADQFRSSPPGPNKIPNGEIMNTEHTWPQSKFTRRFSENMQKTDLHALFPSTSSANSSRGNDPFGEVGSRFTAPCAKARRGKATIASVDVFQPPMSHRGNVARALFYFATRYEMRISPTEESYLRLWHHEDPVDVDEILRNEKIFLIQGTRNPFIDRPEWADAIADF